MFTVSRTSMNHMSRLFIYHGCFKNRFNVLKVITIFKIWIQFKHNLEKNFANNQSVWHPFDRYFVF